jgi:DNA-binding IclR family transcriptional regulator
MKVNKAMAVAKKKKSAKTTYSAPALEKGFDIIELLATAPQGLTSTEIAQKLGRSLSEIFRILLVMERRRWLHKNDADRYSVSYHVLETAFRATPVQALGAIAGPVMLELSQATVQSCHMVVLSDSHGLIVQQQDTPAHSGFAVRLGTRINPVRSASGRVLLAFSDVLTVERVIAAFKPGDGDLKELRSRMATIRERGYELRPSIRSMGVTDISYPIFGFDQRIRATLSMPYLTVIDGSQKIDIEHARLHVQQAARKISSSLGWFPED